MKLGVPHLSCGAREQTGRLGRVLETSSDRLSHSTRLTTTCRGHQDDDTILLQGTWARLDSAIEVHVTRVGVSTCLVRSWSSRRRREVRR